MRIRLLPAVASWLALALPLAASGQEAECRSIIDQALKVHGGEKLATSVKAIHAKGKAVFVANNMDVDATLEVFGNIPQQAKFVAKLTVMGMNLELVQVLDGDKGWASINGKVVDLNADQLKEARQKKYIEKVTGLHALKDKTYKLSPLGETKVNDTPVVGVQVTQKDQPEVNLYFDKKTHMLLKSEYRIFLVEKGQEVTEEKVYQEYKEVIPGAKFAVKMEIKRDGEKHAQLELTEVQAVEPHDASVFAKPK